MGYKSSTLVVLLCFLPLVSCISRKDLGHDFSWVSHYAGHAVIDEQKVSGNTVVFEDVSRVAYDDEFIVGLKVLPVETSDFSAEQREFESNNGFFILSKSSRTVQTGLKRDDFLTECGNFELEICVEVLEDKLTPYDRVVALIEWIRKIIGM